MNTSREHDEKRDTESSKQRYENPAARHVPEEVTRYHLEQHNRGDCGCDGCNKPNPIQVDQNCHSDCIAEDMSKVYPEKQRESPQPGGRRVRDVAKEFGFPPAIIAGKIEVKGDRRGRVCRSNA